MTERSKKKVSSVHILAVAILVALALAVLIWYAVIRESRQHLTVTFLDVGQGDAVFIETPNGQQVLIDGGPDSTVLRRLGEVMPWYDRTIDLVVGTHPDADHIGGLIDVLSRYKVETVLRSSVLGETTIWEAFERSVGSEGGSALIAERGQMLDIGGGAYLQVLFPDRPVPGLETNTGCVVTRLVYGATAFMLPCDAPASVEKYLVSLDGDRLQANVLKSGHHGSKTSSAEIFVKSVAPEYAVFSRGCANKYGHPSPETIETLTRLNIPILDTCTDGSIMFVSDGNKVSVRK